MSKYLDYAIEGKVAIVTGAGTGIGAATAVELAKAGAKVALFGRRISKLEETKNECLKYTPDVIAVSVDVSDNDAVIAGVAEVNEKLGAVQLLVNNAGIESNYQPGEVPFNDYFDMDPEEYLSFYKIHALGHYNMMQACVPFMKEKGLGRIVNITSVTAVTASYSSPAYTSSKMAAICQTRAFAKKYGEFNITVNSIAPGMVNTPMKRNSPPEEYDMVARMCPLKRIAQPIDIARIAVFLCSEDLYLTGQNIIADGGGN